MVKITKEEFDELYTGGSYMNKKDFDKKYVDEMIVVNCKTEELAKEFLKLADSFGYTWFRSGSFTCRTNWRVNREDTVYYVRDGQYRRLEFAKMNGHKIIEFKGENMKNFKVGDKVERIAVGNFATIGDTGTIVGFNEAGDCIVRWDRNVGGWEREEFGISNGYRTYSNPKNLKLIKCVEKNNQNFPEIHITTDGKTTYGVLKQGKEVIKRAEAKLHPDDEFDFETGSKLVMERLFEKEKELRLIDNFGVDKGRVGEETDLEDIFGEKLYVGDEVSIIARGDHDKRVGFIVKHRFNGYKVQGFTDYDFVQGQYGNKYILTKNGKFEDLKEGKSIKSLPSTITVKLV